MENLVLANTNLEPIKVSLIEGLTISSGAKSSATYYHSKEDQMAAIKSQIEKMYGVSKELPLIVATQKGATGFFVSEVLLNEFKHTNNGGACNIINPIDWYDNRLGDKAILTALHNLGENGIPYVLRLFIKMKNEHINNERARKIMLGYIWGQSNLEFYALKYRNKISEILKHIYGVKKTSILISIALKQDNSSSLVSVIRGTNNEMGILSENIFKYSNEEATKVLKLLLFLFKKDSHVSYNPDMFPILSAYVNAKTDITNIKLVPEEVLLGLISSPKHPQNATMWSTKEQRQATKALIRTNVTVTSINQQVRQTKSTAKLGVEKTVNVSDATDFLALYKTGYENGFTPELNSAINVLGEKKKINGFPYANIGIIIDGSVSMTGNQIESKNTPKAIVDYTALILQKSATTSFTVKTSGEMTDLASAFVELLKSEVDEYDAIFILTDGYENSYDGLMDEVLTIFNSESGRNVPVFQISPITGAEMNANVRKLGKTVVSMAVNNPSAIMPQINARLLEIDTKLWLKNQILVLEESHIARTKISVNN